MIIHTIRASRVETLFRGIAAIFGRSYSMWREKYIAVDWRTPNRRAYLVGREGLVAAEFSDSLGLMSVPPNLPAGTGSGMPADSAFLTPDNRFVDFDSITTRAAAGSRRNALLPGNKQAPIAAQINLHGGNLSAVIDWRGEHDEQWSIHFETKSGRIIELTLGGATLEIDGEQKALGLQDEYRSIYAEFAKIVPGRRSSVDREPLRIVADCFRLGDRKMVEDFV